MGAAFLYPASKLREIAFQFVELAKAFQGDKLSSGAIAVAACANRVSAKFANDVQL